MEGAPKPKSQKVLDSDNEEDEAGPSGENPPEEVQVAEETPAPPPADDYDSDEGVDPNS